MKEIELQKDYFKQEPVETIYFGGGTPSLLEIEELKLQINRINQLFRVDKNAEITLEANPDDIDEEKLTGWKSAGINRLSIGIQSFFDDDLRWMNRAHNAQQAIDNLQLAKKYFNNITVDLIYGTPLLINENWKKNVATAISLNIPHLSCYALTVEPKTPLFKNIQENRSEDIDPDKQSEQFLLLMQWMEDAGYEHYEISNFAKKDYRSRHNSSYWKGKRYLGLGPSAHSYDGKSRQWNISNNNIYIDAIQKGELSFEREELTPIQLLNEYIMTSLRTSEGLNLGKTESEYMEKLITNSKKYIDNGLMKMVHEHLILTREGKLLADGIAASLFF